MNKFWIIMLSLFVSFIFTVACNSDQTKNVTIGEVTMMDNPVKVTILYDNYVFDETTKADWGFSCLIEGPERTILFDTGTRGDILMHNIRALNANIEAIDCIVISHDHQDHSGGLNSVLPVVDTVEVFLPNSFNVNGIPSLADGDVHIILVTAPVEICKGVYLTGELGTTIKEQSLVINKPDGAVVITGCSHPGIIHILETAKSMTGNEIQLAFGGFHLMQYTDQQMQTIVDDLKQLGIQNVGATHCTGDRQIAFIKDNFEDSFVQLGTGRVLEF